MTNIIHGTPDEVRTGLDDLQKRTGADELMLTSNAHRRRRAPALVRTHRGRLRIAHDPEHGDGLTK